MHADNYFRYTFVLLLLACVLLFYVAASTRWAPGVAGDGATQLTDSFAYPLVFLSFFFF